MRLKSGDCSIFARLEEEIEALDKESVSYTVVPGITAASAAAATLKVSLTKRHRNSSLQFITGHDVIGYSNQDWASLAKQNAVAAIYMGKSAAAFLQGRLFMHGASANMPITVIENISHPDQKIVPTTLAALPESIKGLKGAAIIMLGLLPHDVQLSSLKEAK